MVNNKKDLLIIDIHSFIDVITNSSSELFICDTKKSVESVKEALESFLIAYNTGNEMDYSFEAVFGKIDIITEENAENIFTTYAGYENPETQSHCFFINNSLFTEEFWNNYPFYEDFENYSEFEKSEKKWIKERLQEFLKIMKGRIFIYSSDDNSIPSELFDLIEDSFNAIRLHLG